MVQPTHVHLSKSIWQTFDRCRLAYRFERVDRLGSDDGGSPALLRGSAGHEVTAALIVAGVDVGSEQSAEIIDKVMSNYALDADDVAQIEEWANDAVGLLRGRGGTARWVEELLAMDRIPDTTVWAKFDAAVVGGDVAPLEVVDWTFGSARVADEEQLAQSVGARVYRLVAGHAEPDQSLRPIAITEVHVPTMTTVTVIPTDDEVRAAYTSTKEKAAQIRSAITAQEFPASPGMHCAWCSWRTHCPASTIGSDQVPV